MAPEMTTNESEEVLPWYTRLLNKLKPSGPKVRDTTHVGNPLGTTVVNTC